MSIQTNSFCWHAISTASETALPFYKSVLGWDVVEQDGQPLLSAPGGLVGHMQPVEGAAAWCSYLAVDDVEARTAASAEAGGTIIVPPTKLPAGAFSVVASPSGAVFGLYQGVEEDEAPKPGPGTIHWVELHSTKLADDLQWLETSFGLGAEARQMSFGPYKVLTADGQSRGGAMESMDTPPSWLAWVEVADVDAALELVDAGGGSVIRPAFGDAEVGQMAVVADPSGAVFGLVKPVRA